MAVTNKNAIVMAIPSMSGGGAERVALNLINNWPELDVSPVLLLTSACGEYLDAVNDTVPVIRLEANPSITNSLNYARALKAALAPYQPSAIVSHLVSLNRLLLRARRLGAFSAPLTVVEHNDIERYFEQCRRSPLATALLKRETAWLYAGAQAVVGVSQGVADQVRQSLGLPAAKVKVVYNPVDSAAVTAGRDAQPAERFATEFMSLPRPIIISAGRLHPQKAFADLIRAYALLPVRERGSLVVLGQGPLDAELRQMVLSLGLEGAVHLPGFTANPWWYLWRADLFALSSHWEGYPMILLEALACGLPIVATDCDYGPREIIPLAAHGRLVPVGDISALGQAMRSVLQAPEMSGESRRPVDLSAFSPAAVAHRYVDIACSQASGGGA